MRSEVWRKVAVLAAVAALGGQSLHTRLHAQAPAQGSGR